VRMGPHYLRTAQKHPRGPILTKNGYGRVAAILSIVETCRRLTLPTRDYLQAVLPGLADFPIARVAELTPGAWATARNLPMIFVAWVGGVGWLNGYEESIISTFAWNPLSRLAKCPATKEIPCKEAYPSCHFP
jgi:hypothetical protein